MTTSPHTGLDIVQRPAQPYAGITRSVTIGTFHEIADRFPEIFGWLGARGIPPVGPPFFRYHLIDMARELVVTAGVPVATAVEGDDTEGDDMEGDDVVHGGVLPAGRYATVTAVGHPKELFGVTQRLLDRAAGQGLVWDRTDTPEGQRWGSRLEFYHTDPAEEPDMNKWTVELAFRLADSAHSD